MLKRFFDQNRFSGALAVVVIGGVLVALITQFWGGQGGSLPATTSLRLAPETIAAFDTQSSQAPILSTTTTHPPNQTTMDLVTTTTSAVADLVLVADDLVESGRSAAWGTPQDEPATLNGEPFPRSIRWNQDTWQDEAWYEWNAGVAYTRFCAVGGIDDIDSEQAAVVEMEVQVGGTVVYQGVTRLGQPVLVDAAFEPGVRIRLVSRGATQDNASAKVVWANPTLTNEPCPDQEAADSASAIGDLVLVADDLVESGRSAAWGTPQDEAATLNGEPFPRSIRWNQDTWQDEAWYEWNAGVAYTRFCAVGGIDDIDSEQAAVVEMEVQVGGTVVYQGVTRLGQPVLVDAAFEPGVRIRLVSRGATQDNASAKVVWANPTLTNEPCPT